MRPFLLAVTGLLLAGFVSVKTTREFGSRESVLSAHWTTHRGYRYLAIESPFEGLLEVKSTNPEDYTSRTVLSLVGRRGVDRFPPTRHHRISLPRFQELGVACADLFVLAPGGEQWRVDWESLFEVEARRVLEFLESRRVPIGPLSPAEPLDEETVQIVRHYLSSPRRDPELNSRFAALAEDPPTRGTAGVSLEDLVPWLDSR